MQSDKASKSKGIRVTDMGTEVRDEEDEGDLQPQQNILDRLGGPGDLGMGWSTSLPARDRKHPISRKRRKKTMVKD